MSSHSKFLYIFRLLKNDSKDEFEDYLQLNPKNRLYIIKFPKYVEDFLHTIKYPEETEYEGMYLIFPFNFLAFTKGIELPEDEFDFIARRAICAVFRYQDLCDYTYTEAYASSLGIVLEKLILKLLMQPEFNTPEPVISFLTKFSKKIQFTDDINSYVRIFHADPRLPPVVYNYRDLEKDNPVKNF